jgi:hypothetical protein
MQVLLELLKRVDALLFHYLATPAGADGSDAGSAGSLGSSGPGQGAGARRAGSFSEVPRLDDSMLLFTRGALTFGTGMQLKLACTRWARGRGRVAASNPLYISF